MGTPISRRTCESLQQALPLARLKHLLHYDPLTGIFTRRVDGANDRASTNAGTRADHRASRGYRGLYIDGRIYKAHRVAWFYVTGEWPSDMIDHRDGQHDNNRWSNLRDVPGEVNQHNRQHGANRNNKTGLLGVNAMGGKFYARIRVDKELRKLGCFDTAEAAHAAYLDAKRALHAGNLL